MGELEPGAETILREVFDKTQDEGLPLLAPLQQRYKKHLWDLDRLLDDGLLQKVNQRVAPTLEGLRRLGTEGAEEELARAKDAYEALKVAFSKEGSGRRWDVNAVLALAGWPSEDAPIMGRVLLLFLPLGVFDSRDEDPATGRVTVVAINDRVYTAEPFSPPPPLAADADSGALTLTIRNFRGLRNASWSPEGTCLIAGPNGSGKSSLLEALAFLRNLYVHGLQEAVRSAQGALGLRHLGAPAAEPIVLELRRGSIAWEVQLAVEGASVNPHPGETLRVGDDVVLHRALFATDWYFRGERRKVREGPCCLRAAIEADLPEASTLARIADVVQGVRHYRSYNLQALRESPEPANGDEQLHPSGRNLYTVLRNWRSAPLRFEDRFAWVMRHVQRAFPNAIRHIEFDSVGQTVAARFFPIGSSDPDQSLPMHLASDGMLVGLLHLTAVAGARRGSLIGIDEMENQLHPHAIRVILAAMREAAEERKVTVALTTHSPVLMNEFRHEPGSFFITEAGHDRFPVALDEALDPDWLAHFSLGDLYDRLEFGAPAGSA